MAKFTIEADVEVYEKGRSSAEELLRSILSKNLLITNLKISNPYTNRQSYKKKCGELMSLIKSMEDKSPKPYVDPSPERLCPACRERIGDHGHCEHCNVLVCPKDVPSCFRELYCPRCRT